jgi:tetratricopeptide (TPR) repeat protein
MGRPISDGSQILGKSAKSLPQSVVEKSAYSYAIHEDLLRCYQSRGLRQDTELEYRWLLAARPGNAMLHYNYACLLKISSRFADAAAEYEKAAQCNDTNCDYVGQCGQMFLYLKQYEKAQKYIDRASQLPGGDKYGRILFDALPSTVREKARLQHN